MPQFPLRPHLPVVKVRHRVRVDPQRELQRGKREAVFEPRDELGFPAQALHLPASEEEGGHRDDGEDDEPGAVLFADARHLSGAVEDGDKVWVERGGRGVRARLDGAAGGAEAEEEEVLAGALGAQGGSGGGVVEGSRGEVPPVEREEGVRSGHGGWCGVRGGGRTRWW